jgi:hypothetical protein
VNAAVLKALADKSQRPPGFCRVLFGILIN